MQLCSRNTLFLHKVFNTFSVYTELCVPLVFKAVSAPRAMRLYVAGTMIPLFSSCFKPFPLHALAVVWGGIQESDVFSKVFTSFCQGCDWVAPKQSVDTGFSSFPHSRLLDCSEVVCRQRFLALSGLDCSEVVCRQQFLALSALAIIRMLRDPEMLVFASEYKCFQLFLKEKNIGESRIHYKRKCFLDILQVLGVGCRNPKNFQCSQDS